MSARARTFYDLLSAFCIKKRREDVCVCNDFCDFSMVIVESEFHVG